MKGKQKFCSLSSKENRSEEIKLTTNTRLDIDDFFDDFS